VNNNFSVEL